MLVNRLPYKFLLIFLVFSLVLIVPFSTLLYMDSQKMISDIDDIQPLTQEQKAVYDEYVGSIVDSLVSYSFYIFIITFILAIFFSQRFLVQVKELYRGAKALKEGTHDISLAVNTNDELAEVTKAFNEMADALMRKTGELMRKNHYISAMLDPLWVIDEDNVIIDINPAFTRLFGYERDEVVGSSVFDFLDEEGDKIMRRKFYEEEGGGTSSSYEVSIISKAEGLIPVLISGAPLLESGEVVGKIGIITDFRTQLALREAIREEKEKADAIMDSMVDPLVVVDRDYRVIKANLAARVSTGRDIEGESCHLGFHGSKEPCFLIGEECPVKVVFETGKSFRTVHEHKSSGGHTVFHEVVAYPVKDGHGEIRHAVETMRDITDRKRFEDEIEVKNRELTTLNGISKILSQSLRAEDIFNKVLDKVVGLLGMDGGGIFFVDEMGRDLTCRFHRGLSDEFVKSIYRVRMGEDVMGKVALTGQPVVSADVSRDRRAEKSVLRHSGIKGFACIPIKGKEKPLGVFFIFSINSRLFRAEEERILNSISEMMGIAFENIRLYEKMKEMYEHNRQRRVEERKNLFSLSSMLAATLDMKSVLASSLSLVRNAVRADLAWLLESDEDGNLLVTSSSGAEDVSEGSVVCPSGSSCIEALAIEKREPVTFSEFSSEVKFHTQDYLKKYSNACSLPLYIGEKRLGALTLYYLTPRVPTEDEVYFLQTVTSVLAVSLERARLYENVILQRGLAETVLESIGDGVMTVDPDGRIISINSAAGGIVGVEPLSVVGTSIGEIFSAANGNAELSWKLEECLQSALGGKMMAVEAGYVSPDGRRLPLMFRSAPVRKNRGEIAGVVYVLRDMSREKELDVMKTDFVRSVSHEFRTPLTAIVGMTEMVLDEEVGGARSRDYLNTILAEGNRLSQMVSDVLDIARIESGKEVFSESEIDFGSLIRGVRDGFDSIIKRKEVNVTVDVGDVAGFRGDEEKLKQLVRILMDNALTYSDKGVGIAIDISRVDDSVRLTVSDEGWGMDQEDIRHLGEKFFRGKNAAKTKGAGLGMALAKKIVGMHGGEMKVESRKGIGTTVFIYLPVRRD